MKVALLGAGRIGRMHGRLLAETPGVDAVVIADADAARATEVAAEVGATAAKSTEAAMDAADAVVIAAATTAHAELIRASIGRGLPTFCEKPLAADLDDTLAVADEIERSAVPFQLGFQRRFDPGYREARRLVETGALGILYAVRLAGHDPAPPHESYIPQSGGLFRDFSIHDFDILRWLTDSEVYPTAFSARGLAYVRPSAEERLEVNRIIMDELVCSTFKPEQVRYLQGVIERLKEAGCDAVVLGCTELPLILSDKNSPLPTLDSTRLLARAALFRAMAR